MTDILGDALPTRDSLRSRIWRGFYGWLQTLGHFGRRPKRVLRHALRREMRLRMKLWHRIVSLAENDKRSTRAAFITAQVGHCNLKLMEGRIRHFLTWTASLIVM